MLKRQISSKEIDRRSSTREVVRDNSTEKVALEIEDTNRVKDLVRDKKPKMSRWRQRKQLMKSKRKRKRRKRLLLPNSTLLIIRNSLNIKTNLKKTKNNSISCRRRIRTSLLKNKKETKEDIRIKDFKINRKKELITINKNFQIWINFKINCNMKMKIFYFLVLTIFCK